MLRGFEPDLIDSIFNSVNTHKPFPELPHFIKNIKILSENSNAFYMVIEAIEYRLVLDRTCSNCITYTTKAIDIQMNENLKEGQYCWATGNRTGETVHHLQPKHNCKTGSEMLMRALQGEEISCGKLEEFTNLLYDISSKTRTGHKFAKYGIRYNAQRFKHRALFNRYFGKKNRIELVCI
jgi:hypothetical protein